MVACALVGSPLTVLTLFYMALLRKKRNISKLQRAQNLLARVVTGSFQSSSHILLERLHWLPVEYRVNFKLANITFLTLHSSQPAYQHSALHAHHSIRSLRSSNTSLLSVPFVGNSFGVHNPTIWNSLPPALRMCKSPPSDVTVSSKPFNPLSAVLLRLRFGFRWPLCAFTNCIYLLTYLLSEVRL